MDPDFGVRRVVASPPLIRARVRAELAALEAPVLVGRPAAIEGRWVDDVVGTGKPRVALSRSGAARSVSRRSAARAVSRRSAARAVADRDQGTARATCSSRCSGTSNEPSATRAGAFTASDEREHHATDPEQFQHDLLDPSPRPACGQEIPLRAERHRDRAGTKTSEPSKNAASSM
jgi:hypothetical protein